MQLKLRNLLAVLVVVAGLRFFDPAFADPLQSSTKVHEPKNYTLGLGFGISRHHFSYHLNLIGSTLWQSETTQPIVLRPFFGAMVTSKHDIASVDSAWNPSIHGGIVVKQNILNSSWYWLVSTGVSYDLRQPQKMHLNPFSLAGIGYTFKNSKGQELGTILVGTELFQRKTNSSHPVVVAP